MEINARRSGPQSIETIVDLNVDQPLVNIAVPALRASSRCKMQQLMGQAGLMSTLMGGGGGMFSNLFGK
jgi:hypothetical protein